MSPATNPSRPAHVEALQAPELEEMRPRELEQAGDEELAELCTSLRDLLGDDDAS